MISTTRENCISNLESWITTGGDERTELHSKTNRNKYGINPIQHQGLLNRGSCTTSPLNDFSQLAAQQLLEVDLPRKGFEAIRDDHEQRLKSLLNYSGQDKFDVFWGPSGSDLIYIPLLFSSLLHPNKRILHMLTCPEELGSGTTIGARGLFFMHNNQMGEKMRQGAPIDDSLCIDVIHYSARSAEGKINSHQDEILNTIQQHPDHAKIGSLVIGSKSGIENNIDVIDLVDDDVMWTVDLCQFRNSKRLINKLLDKGCMIMLTGSKFYQSPPFCGVMLIPKSLTTKLAKYTFPTSTPFTSLFSAYDVPRQLPQLRSLLRPFENISLLTRWECGLSEMEAFDNIPKEKRKVFIQEWNDLVCEGIRSRPQYFELMPNQEMTNNSIISFRVKANGTFLNNGSLRHFFDDLVTDSYPNILSGNYDKIFIGQPVNYGDRSFIRLALGANDIRQLMGQKNPFSNELAVLDIIAQKLDTWV